MASYRKAREILEPEAGNDSKDGEAGCDDDKTPVCSILLLDLLPGTLSKSPHVQAVQGKTVRVFHTLD